MRYAENTSVSVARSRAEVEELVQKYGGSDFISGTLDAKSAAVIVFAMKGKRVQFELPLPQRSQFAQKEMGYHRAGVFHSKVVEVSPEQQARDWEQACRQRWRALALAVKAKLEAVAIGITSFEEEFLAHIVVPGGKRFAEVALPKLEAAYATGKMPPLMLGAGDGS